MRLISSALCTTVALGLLAGCSGNMSTTSPSAPNSVAGAQTKISNGHIIPKWSKYATLIPNGLRPVGPMTLHGRPAPKGVGGGIYASQFYAAIIAGYQHKNTSNNPPICTLGASYPNGIAVDGKGNLIDPDGGTRNVLVYQGPAMCGPLAATIADPYGQPSDASSADALNGTIAVGNIFDNSGLPGSISVCTASGGCTANLSNANMFEVAGVAMANNGDCWADAINSSGTATLTYFAGCTGAGQATTGFMNTYFGGLDIDKKGNLVTISAFDANVYIYSGCNPACTLVGGPFTLNGEAVFGHLNKQSMTFATGDFPNGQIDVYQYSPTSLTYFYSFNNGLSASDDVEGTAFNPRSEQ
jgi:hypothetical protein